jgi:hypothetical protein
MQEELSMSRYDDQRIYRTFEEFEREELRRDSHYASVDESLDELFAGELDFDASNGRRAHTVDDDGDDEE